MPIFTEQFEDQSYCSDSASRSGAWVPVQPQITPRSWHQVNTEVSARMFASASDTPPVVPKRDYRDRQIAVDTTNTVEPPKLHQQTRQASESPYEQTSQRGPPPPQQQTQLQTEPLVSTESDHQSNNDQQLVLYEGPPQPPPLPPYMQPRYGEVGSTFSPYGGMPGPPPMMGPPPFGPPPMGPGGPFGQMDPGILWTPQGPMCMPPPHMMVGGPPPPPPGCFGPPPPMEMMMEGKKGKHKKMKRSRSMEQMMMAGGPPPPFAGMPPVPPQNDCMALAIPNQMAPPMPPKFGPPMDLIPQPLPHKQHPDLAGGPEKAESACYVVCCKGHTQVLWIVVGILLAGVVLGVILGLTLVQDDQQSFDI